MAAAARRFKYSPTITSMAKGITIWVMTLLTMGPRKGIKYSGSVRSPAQNEITAIRMPMISVGAVWRSGTIPRSTKIPDASR